MCCTGGQCQFFGNFPQWGFFQILDHCDIVSRYIVQETCNQYTEVHSSFTKIRKKCNWNSCTNSCDLAPW